MAARFEIADMVFRNVGGGAVVAHQGASVTVKDLSGNNLTVYQAETGSSTFSNPLTSDSNGQIEGWVEAPDFDLAVTGPGISSYTQKVRTSPLGTYAIESYGAKINGSTNDQPAVQAALDAIETAGKGKLTASKAGVSIINSGLSYTGSNLEVELGPGVVLDFSGMAGGNALEILGTEAAAVSLSANAAEGATTVSVAAGAEAGFAAGDRVRVQSNAYYAGASSGVAGVDQRVGESNAIVQSTASGSITFKYALQGGPYNTADNATVSKITSAANIKIRGGKLIGDTAETQIAIKVEYGKHVRISGVELQDFAYKGIALYDCVDATVEQPNAVSGDTSNTTAYGVQLAYGCEDCTVRAGYFRDYRHGVTCSGSTDVGRGGINRRIYVYGNTGVDCRSSAFDCHAGVEQYTVTDNKVYGGESGIGIRCPRATVANNHIWKTVGYGISLTNQSTKPTVYTVTGNVLEDIDGASAIFYRTQDLPATTTQDPRGATFSGNVVYGGVIGLRVVGNVANGFMQRIAVSGNTFDTMSEYAIELDRVSNCTITGNTGTGLTLGGLKVTTQADTVTHVGNTWVAASAGSGTGAGVTLLTNSTVSGNTLLNWATGISLSNSSEACTVVNNNTAGCTTRVTLGTGKGHMAHDNGELNAVVSAASFTPPSGRVVRLTSNTTMNYIKIGAPGRTITLTAQTNPTVTHNAATVPTDFAAVKLAGAANFVMSADDNLTIFYNSVTGFWEEADRTVI